MGFHIVGLSEDDNEFLNGLNKDHASTTIRALMAKFGFAGTYFVREDVDSVVDREITDEEWDKVQDSWFWYKGIPDALTERGWDVLREAVDDAGIPYADDEEEEVDNAFSEG